MDFMKILKSFEEFLFELMVWLIFYPITLWQVLRHPSQMMDYADVELSDSEQDQYDDRLSPPIFLAITLALSHGLEVVLDGSKMDLGMLASEQNLIIFRMILFSVFPLVLSVRLLRRKGHLLDRKAIKPPFYSQCFVAAPFAAVISSTPILVWQLPLEGVQRLLLIILIFLIAIIWYLLLQARWFSRQLGTSFLNGFGHAVVSFCQACFVVLLFSGMAESLKA